MQRLFRFLTFYVLAFCLLAAGVCHAQSAAADAALFAAIRQNDVAGVQNALANGASVTAINKYNQTPLTAAALEGDALVLSLLTGPNVDINAKNGNGDPALPLAVISRQQDAVQLLLQRGADINATNSAGDSAIFYTGSDLEMLTLLLAAQPDLEIVNKSGRSVLSESVWMNHHPEIFRMLWSAGARYTSNTDALYGAAADGDITGIDRLLAEGGNPNGQSGAPIDMTPLMMAAYKGHLEAVRDLLAHGGDPMVANIGKQDTLEEACQSRNHAVVELVLGSMTDLRGSRANFNQSALMTVVEHFDDAKLVDRLLLAGVPVDARDSERMTALMTAAEAGHEHDVAVLLSAGANASLRDRSGRSAADYARQRYGKLAALLDHAAVSAQRR